MEDEVEGCGGGRRSVVGEEAVVVGGEVESRACAGLAAVGCGVSSDKSRWATRAPPCGTGNGTPTPLNFFNALPQKPPAAAAAAAVPCTNPAAAPAPPPTTPTPLGPGSVPPWVPPAPAPGAAPAPGPAAGGP